MAQRADGWPWFAFGLIGAAIIALIGVFGAHDSSAAGVRDRLQAQVTEALAGAGFDGVVARIDGQRAVLSGVAPSEEALAQASATALEAAGPGGRWAGGVTSVDASEVIVGAPVSPFVWEAERRGDGVLMRGHVPGVRVKEALAARARAAFSGEVTDQTTVAAGAPGGEWTAVAGDALDSLALLNRGEARLVDGLLVLIGDGGEPAVEQLRARYSEGLAQPYQARFEVTVTGQRLGIEELGDLDLSSRDADTCQEAFARIMQRNVINFATGSAQIDPSSELLLSNLASVALRCDQFSIEVSGHTDNVGSPEVNATLSQARADAVKAYLRGLGVREQRLTAMGYGADRPRASNATREGQAANRRIEFTVQ